jgi:prepilin-type N-terminal cleavage/methylation domain-containing protein
MQHDIDTRDEGFTLVEILIAIVMVGILAAVVIVGISSLTSKGNSTACTASRDAAISGATVHYTNTSAYPTTIEAMTTAGELTLPAGVTVSGATATNGTWTLTLTPGTGSAAPTFACS